MDDQKVHKHEKRSNIQDSKAAAEPQDQMNLDKGASIPAPNSINFPIQMKAVPYGKGMESESSESSTEVLQLKTTDGDGEDTNNPNDSNPTGIPNALKNGVEAMSGYNMNDVNVHYNSQKPQSFGAKAFAQGSDIHLGSGQEKHLPHEMWHVVQQKQGRVNPTVMKKANVPVNDDQGLEKEADVMGQKALQMKAEASPVQDLKTSTSSTNVHQLVGERLTLIPESAGISTVDPAFPDRPGIIIEVMIQNSAEGLTNARQKIEQLADQSESPLNIAIAIGLNAKEGGGDVGKLGGDTDALIEFATELGVKCAVIPMSWKMPSGGGAGYVFPFLEARAALGQHGHTLALRSWAGGSKTIEDDNGGEGSSSDPVIEEVVEEGLANPVFHRTMDADVSNDPLLGDKVEKNQGYSVGRGGSIKVLKEPKKGFKAGTKMREKPETRSDRIEARNAEHGKVATALMDHGKGDSTVVTGGYDWDRSDLPETGMANKLIKVVNAFEHQMRGAIEKHYSDALYLPEPNTYIPSDLKESWDRGLLSDVDKPDVRKVQMGESKFGRKGIGKDIPVHHDQSISTTKPRKAWLDNFENMIGALELGDETLVREVFVNFSKDIHQSYLKDDTALKTAKGHGGKTKTKMMKSMISTGKEMLLEKILELLSTPEDDADLE